MLLSAQSLGSDGQDLGQVDFEDARVSQRL
jgi:hypothetical protein